MTRSPIELFWTAKNLSCFGGGWVDDPGWEDADAGVGPGQAEDHKCNVTASLPREQSWKFKNILCFHLVSGIFEQLGQLHPVVGQVVHHEDKGAHPVHLVAPTESEKSKGGNVVDEHLPKVFPLHISELGDQEGPVKSHL